MNKTHIPEVSQAVIAAMRELDDSYVLILANGVVLDGVFAPFQLEAVMAETEHKRTTGRWAAVGSWSEGGSLCVDGRAA